MYNVHLRGLANTGVSLASAGCIPAGKTNPAATHQLWMRVDKKKA